MYRKLGNKKLFGKVWYVFIDTNLADSAIKTAKGKIKKEMTNPKYTPYKLRFAKIPEKNTSEFEFAMRDLERKMLLTGHESYRKVATQIFEELSM